MVNFEIAVLDNFGESVVSGDTIVVDTLTLNLRPESIFVAENSSNIVGTLGNQLMAFQCPEAGEYGLKNKIKSISITCDKQVNTYEPNDELIDITLINDQKLNDFLLSQQSLSHYDQIKIKLLEKPAQQESRVFTVKIVFEDNTELTQNSVDFYW